jgi:MoaA/NifB/PqqE/SkfB family radical SAM enzyme
MLKGIHILLTNTCVWECDHCLLHWAPCARGIFTVEQLHRVFDEIERIGSIEEVYFEGGEPLLYHPVLMEGGRLAWDLGLDTGIRHERLLGRPGGGRKAVAGSAGRAFRPRHQR